MRAFFNDKINNNNCDKNKNDNWEQSNLPFAWTHQKILSPSSYIRPFWCRSNRQLVCMFACLCVVVHTWRTRRGKKGIERSQLPTTAVLWDSFLCMTSQMKNPSAASMTGKSSSLASSSSLYSLPYVMRLFGKSNY